MILQIIQANVRTNLPRVLLASLGIVLGLLATLITSYYFTFMVNQGTIAELPPLPADIILSPVSSAFKTDQDVLHYEQIIILNSNTAAGIEQVLVFPVETRFNEGYTMLQGRWPVTGEEIAVPGEWFSKTGLSIGDSTPLTIRYGQFYGTSTYTISGVFESPFGQYNTPVMNTLGYKRAQTEEVFGKPKYFLQVKPGADYGKLLSRIAYEETAEAETSSTALARQQQARLMEAYGDSLTWSYILSTMLLTIASLGVMNMLILASTERKGEIGILKTFGVRSMGIAWLFFGEAFAISVLAVLFTLVIYSLGSLFLLRLGIIPVFAITASMFRSMGLAVMFITVIPPLYPIALNFTQTAMKLIRSGEA